VPALLNGKKYMLAYLFAGQGSQYIGMGKDLYEAFPESKRIFDQADEVLGAALARLCFKGPLEELTKTPNCQPAVLTMSIACLEAFKSVRSKEQEAPSFVAGLSLGEYSALVAAGALSFSDAVYLVRRRGEFMEDQARQHPGKMASILGLDLEVIKDICRKTGSEVANINCPGQIVISGGAKEIEEAARIAEERGARRALFLEVSGAFHSSFMREAAAKLAEELQKIKINVPGIPVISNFTAQPTSEPAQIKENLIKQVAGSVLWQDSMKFVLSKGIMNFIEFGPGKVLKGLMRRIDEKATVRNIEKKEDIAVMVGNVR
jgi:[acyl-carrier-protein] S-malonyltransferase